MSEFAIEIREDHSKEVLKEKDSAINKWLTEASMYLASAARTAIQSDPIRVDTGLLKNSITYAIAGQAPAISGYSGDKPSKNGGSVPHGSYSGTADKEEGGFASYVGTNVEYAIYVHEGTRRMTANHFLKNAFQTNQSFVKEKLKEMLSGG